ncbi:MAG TPA: chemotaxis protein, partial [Cellvibrionales bacterium]|nr:chemotaxis protein [Cellvibrionales bacterium]
MDNIRRLKSSSHSRKIFTLSIAVLVCATLFFIVSTFIFLRDADRDAKYLEMASDMRVLLHQISTSSRAATAGDSSAFSTLQKATDRFDRSYRVLQTGDSQLPGVGMMMKAELQALGGIWLSVKNNSETIVNNRDRILFLHDVAKTLNESIPELQREYNRVVEVLLDRNASNEQIVYAQKQLLLAERIARNVDKMLSGGEATSQAADQFNLDASIFGGVLTGMLEGDKQLGLERIKDAKARVSLERINTLFDFVSGSVDDIFEASPDLLSAKNAADGILNNSPKILDSTNSVVEGIGSLDQRRTVGADTAFYSGAVILIILAVIGTQLYRNTVVRLAQEKNANERNQIAIERLLNEIGNLADGDL